MLLLLLLFCLHFLKLFFILLLNRLDFVCFSGHAPLLHNRVHFVTCKLIALDVWLDFIFCSFHTAIPTPGIKNKLKVKRGKSIEAVEKKSRERERISTLIKCEWVRMLGSCCSSFVWWAKRLDLFFRKRCMYSIYAKTTIEMCMKGKMGKKGNQNRKFCFWKYHKEENEMVEFDGKWYGNDDAS